MARLLVIMGSGETTPTMIKPHRQIFDSLPQPPNAVLLDTPYGFQLNADEISARTVDYFRHSIGRRVEPVSWRRAHAPGLEREHALNALREANWIFAGPGSPTYALRQWAGTELPELMLGADALIFASAAALTLGSHTVPVYEIYKAGVDPRWEPGLNIFQRLTGIPAIVIPHYDNAEGGHHDTRFCYLGEPRLSYLEQSLPEDSVIVGVDEHTALVCDLANGTATVLGNGGLTLRHNGSSIRHESGSVLNLATLAQHPSTQSAPSVPAHADGIAIPEAVPTSVRAAAEQHAEQFAIALKAADVDGCVAAVLELEQAITDWAADTLASDDTDHARGVLRGMLVRLGTLAKTAAPFIDTMIELRQQARQRKDFAAADLIRAALEQGGVEIQDTPEGPRWSL